MDLNFRLEKIKNNYRVYLTEEAIDDLGEVSFVRLPKTGLELKQGDGFAELEGDKAVTEFQMPLSGKIAAVNEKVVATPELLNKKPLETWLIEIMDVPENERELIV